MTSAVWVNRVRTINESIDVERAAEGAEVYCGTQVRESGRQRSEDV